MRNNIQKSVNINKNDLYIFKVGANNYQVNVTFYTSFPF
jgi:hypothetical protein